VSPEELVHSGDTIRTLATRAAEKINEAEADAKASEMMLKQVCEERGQLQAILKGAPKTPLSEMIEEAGRRYESELTKLRELLQGCPAVRDGQPEWVSLTPEWANWIERAKEEALKL
jgi:hypothetical protein